MATKASWTNIAYTSWWGCGMWGGDPYDWADTRFVAGEVENPSILETMAGNWQGFKCDKFEKSPVAAAVFFAMFMVLTAWVVMSLFVGVISIGIFEAFEAMKREKKRLRYLRKLAKQEKRKAALAKMKCASLSLSLLLFDPLAAPRRAGGLCCSPLSGGGMDPERVVFPLNVFF